MYLFWAILSISLALVSLVIVVLLYLRQKHGTAQVDQIFNELRLLHMDVKSLKSEVQVLRSHKQENRTGSKTKHIVQPEARTKPESQSRQRDQNDAGSLWQDVIFLAQQGVSADKISKDLNITRGEVDLILSLQHFDNKSRD